MKKKHLKNAMSITLAVAMLSSTLIGNVANASVIVPDTDVGTSGTGTTTITTDDGITVESSDVVNNNETDDGIVVNDDGIEITTAHLDSSVHVKNDGITIDNDNGLSSGSKVILSTVAKNKLNEAVKFKLYFCKYADNLQLPEDKSTWEYLVKDVPEKLTAEPGAVTVKDADGNETEAKATFMQDKDGDTSTASYVAVEVPANSSISFETNVSNEVAGKVFAIPYLEASSEVSYGNAVGLTWEDDGITVDDSSDNGITVDDDGIEVEDSKEDKSDSIVVDDNKALDDDAFDNDLVVDTEGNVISGVNPSEDEHVVSLKAADGGAIEVYHNDQYLSAIGYTDTQTEQFTVKDGDTLTFKVTADEDYAVDNFVATNTETGKELLSNETTKEEAESEDGITIETEAAKEEDTEAVFTYDVTSDVLIDASFAKVESADVAVDNTDENGIETSEDTIADPVIEQYVRDNADPAYTTIDNMDLVNAMKIKNMLVDASSLDSEHNDIDSIMHSGNIVKYWLGTLDATVPVYELSESSNYFVAYADTMHNDNQTTVTDIQVANYNLKGESLSGWHYDYETGLVYIPKDCFYEDGKISIGKVQMELMQNVKTNQSGEVESNVETTVVNGDDASAADVSTESTNVYDSTYTTEIQKNLDRDNMVVSVNGIPTDVYEYNGTSGELTVGMSPSAIQSISVNGDEQSLIGKMATSLGLKSVSAYAHQEASVALNKMQFACDKAITTQFDKLKVGQYKTMTSGSGLYMMYVNNDSNVRSDTMGYLHPSYDEIDNTGAYVLHNTNKPSSAFRFWEYGEKNLVVDLSSLDYDGIAFDELPNGKDGSHYAGGMYCGHIGDFFGVGNFAIDYYQWYGNKPGFGGCGMRILDMDAKASQPYVTVAICTQRVDSQNAVGIFRFKAKAVTGGIILDKRLTYAAFSSRFSNLRIDTKFQLYKGSTKVGDPIIVKANRNSYRKTVTITGLKPGIYYLEETGVCNGCKQNTYRYKIKVTAGPAVNLFENTTTGATSSMIKNDPYYFQGKILHKYDANTKKGIEGVIFKVEYWNRTKTKDGAQCEGTWYLRSDENGDVKYDNDHLVPDKELKKKFGKNVRNDDPAMITEKKWGFPYGQLYIHEVYAPDGYKFDKTTEYNIKLTKPNYTETVLAHDIETVDVPNTSVGGFLLGKFLYERQSFSNMTPRVRIDTSFGIYKDYDATTGTVSNQLRKIDFKCDEDDLSKTILVQGLEPGTYYLQELERCPGTIQNINIYSFEVKNGETTNHIQNVKTGREGTKVGNVPFRFQGKILTKTDADGNGLGGAVFKVIYSPYKRGEKGAEDLYTWYFKSGDDGVFSYDEEHYVNLWKEHPSDDPFILDNGEWALPSGFLYVTEVESPEGYTLDDTEHEVWLHGKKDENNLFTIKDMYVDDLTIPNDFGEDKWRVRVNLKKVDENGKGLAGAVFGVWDNENLKGAPKAVLTTKDDGTSNIATIRFKDESMKSVTLYCQEKEPPAGYNKSDAKYKVTFERKVFEDEQKKDKNYPGELKPFGPITGIVNTKITPTPTPTVNTPGAGVHVKKISTAEDDIMALHGYTLKGAKFHIYGGEAGDGNRGDSRVDTYVTTDESGISETVSLPDPSWYEYPSHTDSKGNTIYDTPILHPVTTVYTITEVEPPHGHKMAAPKSQQFSVTMPYDKDKVFEKVFSDEPKFTNKPFQIDKVSSKGNSIKGVVFKVEFFDTELEGVNYDAGATTYALDDEDYAAAMDADEDVGIATLEAEDDSMEVDTINVQTLPDSELVVMSSGGSNSIKTDSDAKITDTGMSGTPTRTWYLQSDEKGLVLMDDAHVCRWTQYKSDPFYKHNNQIVIPLYGTLQITEEQCPAEYIKCDEILQFPTTENGDLSARIYNDLEPCKVNIQKFKDDGTTAIPGVEFELKFVKQSEGFTSKQREYKRLLKEGETVTRSTDWEGNCYFDQLDQGDYEITEIKTASGQTLLKDPIKLSIPFKMSEDEANEYEDVNFESAREDNDYTNKWFFYECSYIITNTPTFDLPHTGATGTWNYGFVGLGIALVAGVGTAGTVVTKRRRRKKQNK